MDNESFKKLVDNRINFCKKLLFDKNTEYTKGGDDVLKVFRQAAAMDGETLSKALLGMMKKHIVSVVNMANGEAAVTPTAINEKISDTINYLFLLEAIWANGQETIE